MAGEGQLQVREHHHLAANRLLWRGRMDHDRAASFNLLCSVAHLCVQGLARRLMVTLLLAGGALAALLLAVEEDLRLVGRARRLAGPRLLALQALALLLQFAGLALAF
ncbi:hypothetical protein D3C79_849800 [compost metagenome]